MKRANKIEKETNPSTFEKVKDKISDAAGSVGDAIGNAG